MWPCNDRRGTGIEWNLKGENAKGAEAVVGYDNALCRDMCAIDLMEVRSRGQLRVENQRSDDGGKSSDDAACSGSIFSRPKHSIDRVG